MKSYAFSLIELMVVIAIVAVLAVIAVPSYKTYMIKSKSASDMIIIYSIADKAKTSYMTIPRNALPYIPPYSEGFGPNDTMWPTVFTFSNYGIFTKALDSFRVYRSSDGYTNFEFSVKQELMPASPSAKVIFISTGCNNTACVTYCGWYSVTEEQRSVDMKYLPSSCQKLGIQSAIESFMTQ